MSNKATNEWIASHWQGKTVKQTEGCLSLIGRTGVVKETIWDEKGALHCLMEPAPDKIANHDWWCPAQFLSLVVAEG